MLHDKAAAVFLLFTVAVPLCWIVWTALRTGYDDKPKPKQMKSREIPPRDMRDERAGYVAEKVERFKHKGA